MFIRPNIIRSVNYPNHVFQNIIPLIRVYSVINRQWYIRSPCQIYFTWLHHRHHSYNGCGRRVTVQLTPISHCISALTSQRGIYSCIASLGYVDMAEFIRPQMKSQSMSSKWKARLYHGHIFVCSSSLPFCPYY